MKKSPPTVFVSLRLTFADKARLQQDAAGMAVSDYMRWRLFDPNNPPPRCRSKAPVKDYQALAKVLGLLGQSRLSSNLNQLARSANTGSVPVTPDTESALITAVADVQEIRRLLLEALNLDGGP